MDLFAKDHPLEAAALRMQSAKPKFIFKFEELPITVRRRIYRELLLKPKKFDNVSQPDDDEHEKLSELTENLMVIIGEGDNQMHPEIMRSNKKIHEEAATVLYGENWFTWETDGMQYRPMWRCDHSDELWCPRRYSRLITKMRLLISTRGDFHDPSQADAIYWTTINVNSTCKELILNDFKILKVDFYNALGCRYGGSARKGYYGERCLEPLKNCRAEKFFINEYASPAYAAELKAVIEGPKGAKFLARRKAKEDEPENEYNEQVDFEHAELAVGDLDDSQYEAGEGESKHEDKGGDSVDEGLERAIRQGVRDEFYN